MRQLVLTQARGSHNHDRIIDILFSTHVEKEPGVMACLQNDIDFFDKRELTNSNRCVIKKSLMQIPTEALNVAVVFELKMLQNMYYICLAAGVFAKRWKRQQIVLINRGKGNFFTSYQLL